MGGLNQLQCGAERTPQLDINTPACLPASLETKRVEKLLEEFEKKKKEKEKTTGHCVSSVSSVVNDHDDDDDDADWPGPVIIYARYHPESRRVYD